MKSLSNLISTFFYLGKLPKAPGTWGSLGALLIWSLIPETIFFRVVLLSITLILGFIACENTLKESDDPDPSYIVIDEVVGLWITLLFVPKTIFLFILGFLLFRLFDILKPSFIYSVQFLKGSWGVMLDDILAGILSLLILWGVMA
ncbi:MAG: phosphatidylglycerophosphatase A [Candidatus Marinimicrobia bacterium]|jgi:phosphatidylglycerophosphatase A|nr:phosphatidylglycerophosphatase A [Candidatus Neomarinimicrobiota bacterium]|tara:strand:- start:1517 stop:1954 length:438 start_codon:yes stop_codon:yes gene_type:complete